MTNQMIKQYNQLTSVADDDALYIVDSSDTTDGASGTGKYIEKSDLVDGLLQTSDLVTSPTTYTPTGTTENITFANNDTLAILDLGSATGDVTLTLSGMNAGGAYTIHVIQGATARNLIFPSGTIASSSQTAWASGTRTLTMTATDDAIDVVGLSYDGTRTLLTAEFDLS